jgi:hypothetical protein
MNLEFEIGGQYDGYLSVKLQDAKQCALIAVDEILTNGYEVPYWQQVKTEIEAL